MNSNEREIIVYLKDTSHLFGSIDLCLGDYGYSVHFAWNIEEAIDILRKQHVDLVITDLPMNSPEGLGLLATIQEASPLVTLMILTGIEERVPPCDGHNERADYYLITPGFHEKRVLLPYDGAGTRIFN